MIERRFERTFVLKFSGIILMCIGIVALFLYFTLPRGEMFQYAELIKFFVTADKTLSRSLTRAFIVESVVGTLIIVLVAVFTSHKIAGPIYRFRAAFSEMTSTLRIRPVVLRRYDQLQNTAVGFNNMLKGMEERFAEISEAAAAVEEAGKKLTDDEVSVNTLKEKVEALDKTIRKFKV
ncbi:MAG: hypothetical protein HZA16_02710 [Nitrospirae bacterium]|nr:hypothetical protein [Nitrospirota bacterium]